jgi:hypothetical protein
VANQRKTAMNNLTVRGPAPSRNTHSFAGEGFSGLGAGRQPDGADSGSADTLAHPDDGDVVVDVVGVIILLSGGVTDGHDLPVGLGLVVDVLGTKVHFEDANSAWKDFFNFKWKMVDKIEFLFLPIDAVSSGENDVVGDQGAAAETGAVKETGLVGELVGGGDAAADDLSVGDTRLLNKYLTNDLVSFSILRIIAQINNYSNCTSN